MRKTIYKYVLWLRNRHLLMLDAVMMSLSPAMAIVLRYENLSSLAMHSRALLLYTVVTLFLRIAVFQLFGLYSRYWRYASVDEMVTLSKATLSAFAVCTVAFFGLSELSAIFSPSLPRSLPLIDGALVMMMVGGARLAVRLSYAFNERSGSDGEARSVLIVGAGVAGAMIVNELRANPKSKMKPVGFVDDDPKKRNLEIHGVRVLGPLKEIPHLVKELGIGELIIAMPTASGKIIRKIVQVCKLLKITSRTIPGVFEILSGSAVSQLREVRIEDLLRRDIVETETKAVENMIYRSRVMVTGAGGSIGSELCRQIASFRPEELVMVGHGEDSIFKITNEMTTKHGIILSQAVKFRPVIADIRNPERMRHIIGQYRPQIIFHAAAHKHVGLMEGNSADAVTNNVLGTKILIDLAVHHGVEKVVMISSDKAVNPTSIMGVTKRVSELLVHDTALRHGKAFVAVRFGNVLGSSGSVVPILKRQIEAGGPVLIRHKDASRFFMTIPEAVQLVLQAGAMATCGETYVLDMGQPVKIVDLARDLIRLSGLREGSDIDIVFNGLLPGEKMHEELFYDHERPERSSHEKIFVCQNDNVWQRSHALPEMGSFDSDNLNGHPLAHYIMQLVNAAQKEEQHRVQEMLRRIVPEYRNPTARVKGSGSDKGDGIPAQILAMNDAQAIPASQSGGRVNKEDISAANSPQTVPAVSLSLGK